MSFLAPLFLAGLLALAIPVLVHVTRRRTDEPTPFPSFRFLEETRARERARKRIRHPLLLCLRLLVVALLVLAFARPFSDRGGAPASTIGPEEVVLILDRSYSMRAEDRWEQALFAARERIEALGPRDRLSLVTFQEAPTLRLRSALDHARALQLLDGLEPGMLATRIAPAIKAGASALELSDLSRKRAVLISDFQRSGFRPDADAVFGLDTRVEHVAVGSEDAGNLALSQLSLDRSRENGRDRVEVGARLVNTGEAERRARVSLRIDGVQVEALDEVAPARGATSLRFQPFTLAEPNTRGELRIEDPDLEPDNRLHFVASPGGSLRVLVVDPTPGQAASLYLRRALEISDGAGFELRRARALTAATSFEGVDVALLISARIPSGEAARRLEDFISSGGGLLLAPGEGPYPDPEFLPAVIGGVADAPAQGQRIGFVDHDHGIFELFRQPRAGDFSRAVFFRSRALLPKEDSRVLVRFDDGSPALVEGSYGRGRVLVWSSGLDREWNSLAVEPVFLPFAHRAARSLSGRRAVDAAFPAGTTLHLRGVLEDLGQPELFPGTVAIAPDGGLRELTGSDPSLFLDQPGIWEIREPGPRRDRPLAFAANPSEAESDLARFSMADFAVAAGGATAEGGAKGGESARAEAPSAEDAPELLAAAVEQSQGWWRYILAVSVVLLIVETVWSNRLARTRASS